jgi:hypothetical protein
VARLAFYRHIVAGHVESMLEARAAFEAAVRAGSTAPDVHAMLAFMLGVIVLNGRPGTPRRTSRRRSMRPD